MAVNIRVSLQGGEQIANSLRQIGPASKTAFDQIKNSVQQATQPLKDFTEALGKVQGASLGKLTQATGLSELTSVGDQARQTISRVTDQVKQLADAHKTASDGAEKQTSSLRLLATSLGIVVGAAAAIGTSLYFTSKKAAEGIKGIADAAEEFGGQDLEKYQQAKYILQQLGMNADEADRAIKTFTENSQKNIGKVADKIKEMGFRFPDTKEGIEALENQIKTLGGANAALDPLLKKLKDMGFVVAPNIDLGKFATSITKLAEMTNVFQKVKDATPDVIKGIKDTADMMAALGDESQREKIAIALFGDEAGKKLVEKMSEGSAAVDDIILDMQRLGKFVGSDMVESASAYNAAMGRMGQATQNMRNQLGAQFLPLFTQGILGFTNILLDSSNKINQWTSGVRDTLKRLGTDIGSILQGGSALNFNWLNVARDAVVDFGQGVAQVFRGVVVPAFNAVVRLIPTINTAFKQVFGEDIKASAAIIAGILSYWIAGFKGVAAAAGLFFALFRRQDVQKEFETINVGYNEVAKSSQTASSAVSKVGEAFRDVWKAVGNFFTSVKTAFSSLGGIGWTVLTGSLDALSHTIDLFSKLITNVTPSIKKFFGDEGIWPTVRIAALIAILASLSGVFNRLAQSFGFLQAILWTISGTFSVFTNAITLLGQAFAGLSLLITPVGSWLVVLGVGFVLLIKHFNDVVAACDVVAAALNKMFGTEFFTGLGIATAGVFLLAGALAGVFVAACYKAAAALAVFGVGLLTLEQTSVILKGVAVVLALLTASGVGKNALASIGEGLKKWADYRDELARLEKQSKDTNKTLGELGSGATGQGFTSTWQTIINSLGLSKDQVEAVNKEISKLFGNFGQLGQKKIPTANLDDFKNAIQGVGTEAETSRTKLAQLGFRIVPPGIDELWNGIKKAGNEADRLKQKMSQDFGFRWVTEAKAAATEVKQVADAAEEVGAAANEVKPSMTSLFGEIPKDADQAKTSVKSLKEEIIDFMGKDFSWKSLQDLLGHPSMDWVENTKREFKAVFGDIFKDILPKDLPTTDTGVFKNLFDNIKKDFQALLGWMKTAWSETKFEAPNIDISAKSKSVLAPGSQEEDIGIGDESIRAIGARIGGVFQETIRDALMGLPGIISSGFQDALPDIREVIEKISDMIDDMILKAASAWEALSRIREGFGQEGQPAIQPASLQQPAAATTTGITAATLVASFEQALGQITAIWEMIVSTISDTSRITAALASMEQAMIQPFQEAEQEIETVFNQIASAAETMSQRIVTAVQAAVQAMQQMASASSSSGEMWPGYQYGGLIRGRPGVDTNLGWFSDYEYIMQPAAVRYWGVRFMDWINAMMMPPHFQLGGLNLTQSMPMRAFAMAGGQSTTTQGAMRTLRLVIGSREYDTVGPASVISALEREAVIRNIASAGPAPSYVR